MAQITGQAGVNLSQELANYLSAQQGNLTSEQIASIVNQYLVGGDKLAAQQGQVTTGIFKRFTEFDQITGKIEVVTTGLWSGDTGSLSTFFTSSTQATAASSEYYLNVYDADPSTTGTVQYALAYGHKTGSGSTSLVVNDNSTQATKATYAQYAQILLDEDQTKFEFTDGTATGTVTGSDNIYVINVARARYKEEMDAGNWSLILSGSDSGSVTFIDDSGKKFSDRVGKAGRVFNVAEGALNLGTENDATVTSTVDANGQGYGLFYPDQGIIVLNPLAIHTKIGTSIDSGSNSGASVYTGTDREGKNQFLLHNAIVGGGDFQARRTENVSTAHYFVRATNREFNFSNNPTFTTGSNGAFTESTFERDPKTFITTVGLYNNANELLAVAKTSQPIPKSFDKEVLIKVKLDF